MLSIVPYHKSYASSVSQLFHDAVHAIDESIYCAAQKQAWSKAPRSRYHWHKRLSNSQAWLALDDSQLQQGRPCCCGFINLETSYLSTGFRQGYIDSLYVRPEAQGKGIATDLYQCLQAWSDENNISVLTVDASILSKPLFLSQGFRLRHRSYQEKSGQVIMGFLMEKALYPPA